MGVISLHEALGSIPNTACNPNSVVADRREPRASGHLELFKMSRDLGDPISKSNFNSKCHTRNCVLRKAFQFSNSNI